MGDVEEKRVERRDTMISWECRFSFNHSEYIASEIFDCSVHGAFIRAEKDVCAAMKQGESVMISGSIWSMPFELVATVRWIGYSQNHQCDGFGIEFERAPTVFRLVSNPPASVYSMDKGMDKGTEPDTKPMEKSGKEYN
ncbi:MAG: hypothetical protein GY854_17165 [Deltaproteobacteria bacterium]|nr:hypothetical protein [Deltaproteobacteria bacterium]